ncbi:YqeG family HAD IIIA-type phosphatase [Candidatus Berkelbacteria bacterium]|nr:YqeG family HAD IIIA-type phosphatase [Candidatus Berkelbacteria bacterium]
MSKIQTRWSWFNPDYYLDHLEDLTLAELKKAGVKGVIFDYDNTLISSAGQELAESREELLKNWIDYFGADNIMIVSNKLTFQRSYKIMIKEAKRLGIKAYATNFIIKPIPFSLNQAVGALGLKPNEVLMVGDLIITDIIAGKLAKTKTLLIKPVKAPERKLIRLLRFFEKLLLNPEVID